MRARLDLDVARPEDVQHALDPALRDSNAVRFDTTVDDQFHVTVESEKLGALRGATNTALMLSKLSDKILR